LIADSELIKVSSDEPGLAQVADKDGVDELVLRHCLHHQHPLLPQVGQHLKRIQF